MARTKNKGRVNKNNIENQNKSEKKKNNIQSQNKRTNTGVTISTKREQKIEKEENKKNEGGGG